MASLAAELDVHESAISRWRKGDAMSLEKAVRLCEVLDISLDWLLLGRGGIEGHYEIALNGEEREIIRLVRDLPSPSVSGLVQLLAPIADVAAGRAGQ